MSGFEQHVRGLKQQHANQITDMQILLDKQSTHIESLEAESQSLRTAGNYAKRAADSAKEQLNIMEKKLAAAKSELVATGAECADLYARLHESDTKVQSAKAAAKYAADRDVNMQQQISALKHRVAASSHDHEIVQLQHQLERAHQQIADLQHQCQIGRVEYVQTQLCVNKHFCQLTIANQTIMLQLPIEPYKVTPSRIACQIQRNSSSSSSSRLRSFNASLVKSRQKSRSLRVRSSCGLVRSRRIRCR